MGAPHSVCGLVAHSFIPLRRSSAWTCRLCTSGPVTWRDEVPRFQSWFLLGQRRVAAVHLCLSFDRVLHILRELPINNAFRAAIELSRDLTPSGMQSGSEFLYFTLGATWDFLVNFLKNSGETHQSVCELVVRGFLARTQRTIKSRIRLDTRVASARRSTGALRARNNRAKT